MGCVSPIFWHKSPPLFSKWLLFHEGSKQPIRFFWMNFRRFLLAITLIVALPMPALFAAADGNAASSTETAANHGDDAHGHEGGHHGLPKNAVPLFFEYKVDVQVFDDAGEPVMKDGKPETKEKLVFAITNSMVVTWIVALWPRALPRDGHCGADARWAGAAADAVLDLLGVRQHAVPQGGPPPQMPPARLPKLRPGGRCGQQLGVRE